MLFKKKRTDKERLKIMQIINIVQSLFIILFGVLAVGSPLLWSFMESIREASTSCKGIENFYHGDDFFYDLHWMKSFYEYQYSKTYPDRTLKTPDKMGIEKGFDCEDGSHAIMCLCELYNQTCKIYTMFQHPGENDWLDGHVGVLWFNNQTNLWEEII